MYTGQTELLSVLREKWLPVALLSPAAFHQFLANLAFNIFPHNRDSSGEKQLYYFHHSKAIELVKESVENPSIGTSDEMIVSVVTLLRHSVSGIYVI